jgi:hypothetical protein
MTLTQPSALPDIVEHNKIKKELLLLTHQNALNVLYKVNPVLNQVPCHEDISCA